MKLILKEKLIKLCMRKERFQCLSWKKS